MTDETVPPRSPSTGRRRFVRVPVSIPAIARAPQFRGEALHGLVRNISAGGMLIELPRELAPGTTAEFVLETQRGPLALEGRIVWTAPSAGGIQHSVAFTEPMETDFAVNLFFGERR